MPLLSYPHRHIILLAYLDTVTKPAKHNFEILRNLVLPDGFVLRAKHAGRPTRDCLFKDPVMDGKRSVCLLLIMYPTFSLLDAEAFISHKLGPYSLLKIWNLNEFTGVVGIFNCQGAGN